MDKVWLLADDPEGAIDSVPYASREDVEGHVEDLHTQYFKDTLGVDTPVFVWREEQPPWQGIFVLYVNGQRQPITMWESEVFTRESARDNS